MHVEVVYPVATGVILVLASAYALKLYQVSGNAAVLWLGLGLLFVALQVFMDGYLAYLVASSPAIKGTTYYYFLDAVRGTFIVLWAMAQSGMMLSMAGVQDRWVYLGLPLVILVAGVVYTFTINMLSGIPEPDHRIKISSIGRVMGLLIPVALLLGIYMLAAVARPTGSRGAAFVGIAFIVHALTLPAYPFAKAAGPAALGLWYGLGGVVPSFLALWGFRLMLREQA